jgi:hypothetical protein
VIDLYQWMPGWGEEAVTERTEATRYVLDVSYDLTDNPDDGLGVVSVVFDGAVQHSSYWAPSLMGVCAPGGVRRDGQAVWDLGVTPLVAQIKKASSLPSSNDLREYTVWFESSGRGFNVVASSVAVA